MTDMRSFQLRRADGEIVHAVEIQEWINAGTHSDPHARVKGLRSYELEDGSKLNRSSDGKTYTVVRTGEVLSEP